MSWDLRLDPKTHDLTYGRVNGPDEILQRLKVRLWRQLGEWFLNREAGLPWYHNGSLGTDGILGSKDYSNAELLIRSEILRTNGVQRIVGLRGNLEGRAFTLYAEVLLEGGSTESFTLEHFHIEKLSDQ